MSIDRAMGYELVSEWLPDFIAYADRPTHPLANDILDRATKRIHDSYAAYAETENIGLSPAPDVQEWIADDVVEVLLAVAELIVGGTYESVDSVRDA